VAGYVKLQRKQNFSYFCKEAAANKAKVLCTKIHTISEAAGIHFVLFPVTVP